MATFNASIRAYEKALKTKASTSLQEKVRTLYHVKEHKRCFSINKQAWVLDPNYVLIVEPRIGRRAKMSGRSLCRDSEIRDFPSPVARGK